MTEQIIVENEIDAMFALPLAEFIPARKALVARLKQSRQVADAERVKGLAKPSISAWAVNQLYWKHRTEFDRLITTGQRFRDAQASQLTGKNVETVKLADERRKILSDLSRLVAEVLREGGHNSTPDTMRRITTTLEALSAYASLPDAPSAGRLTDDLDPPGFEVLAILMADAEKRSAPVIPLRQSPPITDAKADESLAAKVGAAKASLAEAQRELKLARDKHQALESLLKKATVEAKEAERRKHEAEERFQKATATAAETAQRVRDLETDEQAAAHAVENAQRTVETESTELTSLLQKSSR